NYGGHKKAAIGGMTKAEKQLNRALNFVNKKQGNTKKGNTKKGNTKKEANAKKKPNAKKQSKTKKQPKAKKQSNTKKKSNKPATGPDTTPQLAKAIKELHNTNTVLQHANHDYGGHRVAAMRDVNNAIQQLQEAIKYAKGKNGGGGAAKKRGKKN